MENIYASIPYPNFNIKSYVTRKAEEYCDSEMYSVHDFAPKTNKEEIDSELYNLSTTGDRIQFCTYVIGHINQMVSKHLPECKSPHCEVEDLSQDILYHLYKKLSEYGINPDVDSFTAEETYKNNHILDEVIEKLNSYKSEPNKTDAEIEKIEVVITEAESLKGLQVLGRSKWFLLIGGFMLSYTATVLLDEYVKNSIIALIVSMKDIPQHLLP